MTLDAAGMTNDDAYHLNKDYRHYCFECGLFLSFIHFLKRNLKFRLDGLDGNNVEYLKKLWKSPDIQFYCCECIKKY